MHDIEEPPKMTSARCRQVWLFLGALMTLVIYNEWLAYYLVLLQCQWPSLDVAKADYSVGDNQEAPLRVLILADTHLLGSRDGHWFDKLRREWQMQRSFQASMWIHNPEAVFILGDLFDEGKWCSDSEFKYYVERFRKMFQVSEKQQLHVVVGNHDIGFHYETTEKKRHRFASALSSPSVRLLQVKGNSFVLLNSMAFQGDSCDMCQEAEVKIKSIANTLKCAQGISNNCVSSDQFLYTKPIILQHFPMFRLSDGNCTGPDAAPANEKNLKLKPRWDCLSKESSNMLMEMIQPRLILSGHTHHFCQTTYNGVPEWTVASFSWRYKNNPSFLLMTISNNNYEVNKCFLPQESTIIFTYITGVVLIVVWFTFHRKLLKHVGLHSISKRN